MRLCWMLAQMSDGEVLGDALDEIINSMVRAETIGPMIDPTLWIQKGKAMQEDLEIAEAVRNLRNVYRKLKGTHEKAKRDR